MAAPQIISGVAAAVVSVLCAVPEKIDRVPDHGFTFPASAEAFTSYEKHGAFYANAHAQNRQATIDLAQRLQSEFGPSESRKEIPSLQYEIDLVLLDGTAMKYAAEACYAPQLHDALRNFVWDWKILKAKWPEADAASPCPRFDGDAELVAEYLEWSLARAVERCRIIDAYGYRS